MTFTGTSQYEFDLSTRKVTRHSDTWDAIQDQAYFSVEGLRELVRQATNLRLTPKLESPPYTTLLRFADFEVRRYEPYLVCETDTESAEVTTGSGFNTLASYIFGGNEREEKMSMTTPVFTSKAGAMAAAGGTSTSKMAFPVMEGRYGAEAGRLPAASSGKVALREERGGSGAGESSCD